jgi:hypothetical protein
MFKVLVILWSIGANDTNDQVNETSETQIHKAIEVFAERYDVDDEYKIKAALTKFESTDLGFLISTGKVEPISFEKLEGFAFDSQNDDLNLVIIGHVQPQKYLKHVLSIRPNFDSLDLYQIISQASQSTTVRLFSSVCYSGRLLPTDFLLDPNKRVCGVFSAFENSVAAGCGSSNNFDSEMNLLDWLGEDLSQLVYESLFVKSSNVLHFSSDRLLLEPTCWQPMISAPMSTTDEYNRIVSEEQRSLTDYLASINTELIDQASFGEEDLALLTVKDSLKALWARANILRNRRRLLDYMSAECRVIYDQLKRCERGLSNF